MPFIEIQGPPLCREARAALARATTDALVAAYAIDPGIVTTYFIDVVPGSYAHGGALGDPDEVQRVFVKAFRRPMRAAGGSTDDYRCIYEGHRMGGHERRRLLPGSSACRSGPCGPVA